MNVPPARPGADADGPSRRVRLAERLRRAIDEGRIDVHYQPLVDITGGGVVRLEALARWDLAEPGGSAGFVQAAEQTGVVAVLDLHLLGLVVEHLRVWRLAGITPAVSTNMSQRTLERESAVRDAIAIVRGAGIDPTTIQIEVTETHPVDVAAIARSAGLLRDAGFRVALDDFGTRYSLVEHLVSVPVDELKIDQSLVWRLGEPRAVTVCRTIVSLAHEMGISVVAEGVETVDQLEAVRDLGCDTVQGFLFSHALTPVDTFDELLRLGAGSLLPVGTADTEVGVPPSPPPPAPSLGPCTTW